MHLTTYISLGLVVLGITALWPITGWVLRRGGRTEAVGIFISLTGLAIALSMALAGRSAFSRPAVGFGAAGGVAFAVGYCLIIFYCLKIGPSGPTATLNNLGMIWPVVIDLVFFRGISGNIVFLAGGLSASVLAVVLMSVGRADAGGDRLPITRSWLGWALVGWALAGVSNSTQLLSGIYAPGGHWPFITAFYAAAVAVLVPAALLRKTGRPRWEEVLAGGLCGVLFAAVILPSIIRLVREVPGQILFPLTQSAPIVLILLAGKFILKERLTRTAWAACLAGAAAVALLGLAASGR